MLGSSESDPTRTPVETRQAPIPPDADAITTVAARRLGRPDDQPSSPATPVIEADTVRRSARSARHCAKLTRLKIEHGLLDLAHGVHDEWTLGCHRLVDRCAGEDQQLRVSLGLNGDGATIAVEQYDLCLPRSRIHSLRPRRRARRRLAYGPPAARTPHGCVPSVERPRHQWA